MKKWLIVGIGAMLVVVGLFLLRSEKGRMLNPMGEEVVKELPYAQYAFERLVAREDEPSQIEITEDVFSFMTEGKRVTGAITVPTGPGPAYADRPEGGWPVVVMLRGYADKEVYYTGYGTKNGAKYYSEYGYVTLAPDFLGYGGSDPEDEDALGARVVRPATVLDLLASLSSLDLIDTSRVYLWGHSNGGQIALSVLEILGRRQELGLQGPTLQATTLWAPVSRPFPYSILYYTYDWDPPSPDGSGGAGDQGKALRKALAKFEEDYDVFDYSVASYWDWIKTPIQIHQGTADEAVPVEWSDELVESLKKVESLQGQALKYYRYPEADHNMRPVWEMVVARDVEWFGKFAK